MKMYVNFSYYLIQFLEWEMLNVSDKSYRENQNTHFLFNNFFLNRAVYGVSGKIL
jgi:hypothetical protein